MHLTALRVHADRLHGPALARHAQRELQSAWIAHRVDAHVDPAPVGRLAGGRARVVLAQMNGLRAEGRCHRQPLGDGVDRDHMSRSSRACSLHRA